ncbi:hypothetical protein FJZ39_03890 [Candidatus Saccharibacteria bacterium]|nr:hypothetical protein [Candidatus Saccharibacteria bacterium]
MSRRTPWFEHVLSEYSRSTVVAVSAILAVLLMLSLVQFVKGGAFVWNDIALIDQPDILSRTFYSALTFVSIGAILYQLQFYRFLSWIFGSDRSSYKEAKRIIWVGLILIMYWYIVPVIVDLLNSTVSFAYNVSLLVLYLSPVLFIGVAGLFIVATVYRVKLKNVQTP